MAPASTPLACAIGGTTGVDLTNKGASTGLQLSIGADQDGGTVTLLVYTDGINASTVTVPIPNTTTGAATSTVIIPFSTFNTLLGNGANFANVGAVQLQITGVDGVDGDISLISAIGPNVQTVNMQNFNQISLGNLVWNDANNNGLYNSATEAGMANVLLDLYSVPNATNTFSASDTLVGTTTTDSNGGYSFTNLLPGNYIVQVDPSNFSSGGPLDGYAASTGLVRCPTPMTACTAKTRAPIWSATVSSARHYARRQRRAAGRRQFRSQQLRDHGLRHGRHGRSGRQQVRFAQSGNRRRRFDLYDHRDKQWPHGGDGRANRRPIPSNVTYVSSSAGTFNAATDTLTDAVGNLAVGASQQFTVTVAVAAGFTGSVTNTATISGDQPDPNLANNTSTVTTTVNPETDLAIVKTGSPNPVTGGPDHYLHADGREQRPLERHGGRYFGCAADRLDFRFGHGRHLQRGHRYVQRHGRQSGRRSLASGDSDRNGRDWRDRHDHQHRHSDGRRARPELVQQHLDRGHHS